MSQNYISILEQNASNLKLRTHNRKPAYVVNFLSDQKANFQPMDLLDH
jgi:hypothetical protein